MNAQVPAIQILRVAVKRRDLDCRRISDGKGITVCRGGKLKFDPRTATECEKPLCK
jgi:hypothetical protein